MDRRPSVPTIPPTIRIVGAGDDLVVALARALGAKFGGAISNQPLVVSSVTAQMARDMMERLPARQARNALLRYLTDPEKYLADMERMSKQVGAEKAAAAFMKQLVGPTVGAAAGAAQP